MKHERLHLRLESPLKRYLEQAAAFDHKSLSALMIHAVCVYAYQLRQRGWNVKQAPASRDARRKAA